MPLPSKSSRQSICADTLHLQQCPLASSITPNMMSETSTLPAIHLAFTDLQCLSSSLSSYFENERAIQFLQCSMYLLH